MGGGRCISVSGMPHQFGSPEHVWGVLFRRGGIGGMGGMRGDEGEAKNVGGGVKAAVDDMSQSPGAYTCTILHTQAERYRELAGDTVDRYSR